jgi:hypothetical protein
MDVGDAAVSADSVVLVSLWEVPTYSCHRNSAGGM